MSRFEKKVEIKMKPISFLSLFQTNVEFTFHFFTFADVFKIVTIIGVTGFFFRGGSLGLKFFENFCLGVK